jgi:hypothetical protein
MCLLLTACKRSHLPHDSWEMSLLTDFKLLSLPHSPVTCLPLDRYRHHDAHMLIVPPDPSGDKKGIFDRFDSIREGLFKHKRPTSSERSESTPVAGATSAGRFPTITHPPTHSHVRTHTRARTPTHSHVHTCIYTLAYTHLHKRTHAHKRRAHTHTHTHTHTHRTDSSQVTPS